jgi:hypothetical protein
MFLYRDILKKSVAITFSHKNLWFFGIFASLLGGIGQYSMSLSRSPEDWTTSIFSAAAVLFGQGGGGNFFSNLARLYSSDPVSATILAVFMLIVIVVSLFILWLAVVSQGGLINNAATIIKNNRKDILPLREGMEKGIQKFWPLLGFNLVGVALTCFFAALVGLPIIFLTASSSAWVFLLYVVLFIIFIPLALIISFLVKYSVNYSVLKEKKFVDGLVDAFRLFIKYWLISIELALILFIIDFLFVFILGLILLVLAIPYVFFARVLSLAFFVTIGSANFFQFAIIAGLFLAVIIVVLGCAIITTFKTVAWTDIFISLVDKKGGLAKLERMAAGMRK